MIRPIAVDTSALVAILNREPETERFLQVLDDHVALVSPPTMLEVRLWLLHRINSFQEPWFEGWLGNRATRILAFGRELEQIAATAYNRFGKGRHAASLNYGDCMSYAVAVHHDAPLLFKGGDFGRTDVRPHPASAVLE